MRNSMFKSLIVAAVVIVAMLPLTGVFATGEGFVDDYSSYSLATLVENLPTSGYSMSSNVASYTANDDPLNFSGLAGNYIFVDQFQIIDVGLPDAISPNAVYFAPMLTLDFDAEHTSYSFTYEVQDFGEDDVEATAFSGETIPIIPNDITETYSGVDVVGFLNDEQVFVQEFYGTLDTTLGLPGTFWGVASNSGVAFDSLDVYFYSDFAIGFDNLVIDGGVPNECLFNDGRLNNNPAKDCAPAHVDYCDGTTLTVRNVDGLELLQVPVSEFANPPAEGSVIVASGNGIIVSQDDSTNVYVTGWEVDPFWGDGLKPYVIKINQACTTGQNVSPLNP